MAEKEIKSIAIRVHKNLNSILEDTLQKSNIFSNKPEFTVYALKKTYEYVFECLSKDLQSGATNFVNSGSASVSIKILKTNYDSYLGELNQYMIRIPMSFYEKIIEMCEIFSISLQDFIKGSIITELISLQSYEEEYKMLHRNLDNLNINEIKDLIKREECKHINNMQDNC